MRQKYQKSQRLIREPEELQNLRFRQLFVGICWDRYLEVVESLKKNNMMRLSEIQSNG